MRYTQQTSLNVQNSLSCTNLPFVRSTNLNKISASSSYTNLGSSTDAQPQALPDNSVVNLSNKILTQAQLSLLSKGLNFCPMPGSPNKGELAADINRFKRNLRLIAFFGENNGSRPSNTVTTSNVSTGQTNSTPPCNHPDLRNKSTWSPPIGPLALERLLFLIEQDLGKYCPSVPKQRNLTRSEREALTELKAMSDIIIKPADKGSAVVILNKERGLYSRGH